MTADTPDGLTTVQVGILTKGRIPGRAKLEDDPLHEGWQALHGQPGSGVEPRANIPGVEGDLLYRQVGIAPERHEPPGAVGKFLPILRAKLLE